MPVLGLGGVDEGVDVLVDVDTALSELDQPRLGLDLFPLGVADGNLELHDFRVEIRTHCVVGLLLQTLGLVVVTRLEGQ